MKKFVKGLLLLLVAIVVVAMSYVLIYFPGVMTGMDAKVMCSCVFVSGRTPESVKAKELKVFPGLTWANIIVDDKDSTVSATMLWKTSKAVFRKGLGCTLLAERSEQELVGQQIQTPILSDPHIYDSIPWPMGNRISDEKVTGVDYAALEKAIANAFHDVDPENPINTHAVVILYDGKLIGEKYAEGFDNNSRLMGWSMTKSIGNAFMGIFLREQRMRLEDPAPVKEWQDDDRKAITINNLLQASSGLEWSESYFLPTSEFHEMFTRRDDKAGFAANLPLEKTPGTFFEYSSGTSNILSKIMREKIGDKDYHDFPYKKLFHRIGMNTAIIEPDASGTFVMSSYSYASARDWAGLGLLYLNDGVFNGERILPEGWVKYSTTAGAASPMREYGAQIWLNHGRPENPSDCFLPGVPNDAYLFEGFERNSVTIIPSSKLVIVRLGVTHNSNFSLEKFILDIISSVPAAGSIADRDSDQPGFR